MSEQWMGGLASAVLGSTLYPNGFGSVIRSSTTSNLRSVKLDPFPAADQVQGNLQAVYGLFVPELASNVAFNETFTFELQYVPEPSAPLMLGSGAGLLGLLASVFGPRLPSS